MTAFKSFIREIVSYPNNIKLIAILSALLYLFSGTTVLEALGDSVVCGLVAYGLLFYTVEAIRALRVQGTLRAKLVKITRLPVLHTEPLALIITSLFAVKGYYGTAAPDPGSRIAMSGMIMVVFFILFIVVNFFLSIIKYLDTGRLYNEPVKTGGLWEKIFPVISGHIVKFALFLSITPALITFMGIFIREQSLSIHKLMKYRDVVLIFLVFLPCGLWLVFHLFKKIRAPLSRNLARLVIFSLRDISRGARVATPEKFLKALEKRNDMIPVWQKIYRDSPRLHRELAVNYLYLRNYDLSIHHFQEYLKGFNPKKLKADRQLRMVPFIAGNINKAFFKKYLTYYEYSGLLDENFGHIEYLRPIKALENFEKDKEKDISPELKFIYSTFLEMMCRQFFGYHLLLPREQKEHFTSELLNSKTQLQWKETILSVLARPEEYRRESLGDSLNVVFEISNKNYFRDAFVLKGQANRENLQKEWQNTENLRAVVEEFPEFLVPFPLHITEETISYDNRQIYVYAMRRNRGISVLEFIKRTRRYSAQIN